MLSSLFASPADFLSDFIQISVFYSKQTLFPKCEEEPEK